MILCSLHTVSVHNRVYQIQYWSNWKSLRKTVVPLLVRQKWGCSELALSNIQYNICMLNESWLPEHMHSNLFSLWNNTRENVHEAECSGAGMIYSIWMLKWVGGKCRHELKEFHFLKGSISIIVHLVGYHERVDARRQVWSVHICGAAVDRRCPSDSKSIFPQWIHITAEWPESGCNFS